MTEIRKKSYTNTYCRITRNLEHLRKARLGILFLDSTYKKIPAFLDDLFDEDKKEIYSAIEYLTLNSVGSLI